MNQVSLRLREVPGERGIAAEDLNQDDLVKLHSEQYDQDLFVRVTHRHGEEIGGDLMYSDYKDPMLGQRDQVHFQPEHVLEVRRN